MLVITPKLVKAGPCIYQLDVASTGDCRITFHVVRVFERDGPVISGQELLRELVKCVSADIREYFVRAAAERLNQALLSFNKWPDSIGDISIVWEVPSLKEASLRQCDIDGKNQERHLTSSCT